MQWLGESQCGSVHRRWNHQTPCNVSDHTKSKHCIGWHNCKLVSQGMMLLTAFIHVGRHIILLKGIHHSLFCHMEVELGKALSSYVQDFFVLTYILHQITMDFILVHLTAGQSLHFISMCFLVRHSGFPKCSTDTTGRGENLFHHFLCKLISMYFFLLHFVQTIRHTAM